MDATRQVTRADRCTLWLLNQEEQKLWTHILVKNGLEEHLEYRELILKKHVSAIAVQVANSKQTRNIEYDFYDSSDAVVAIELDKKNNYRTCSLLCMPVLDEQNSVIGVTQLVNKTCTGSFSEYNHQTYPMAPAQWRTHFSKADERRMRELNEQIANVIESFNYLSKIEKDENLLNALAWLTKVSADCLSADRATIFLLNEDRTHLWSLIADDGQGGSLEEIEVPVDGSLAGEVVRTKKILKIDSDFYQDSRSITSQKIGLKTGYYIDNILAIPILNEEQNNLLGVIEFFNKINPFSNPDDDLSNRIDTSGFDDDEIQFFQKKYAKGLAKRVQEFIDFHKLVKQYKNLQNLHQAERRVTKLGLSDSEKLRRAMEEARRITLADRVSLWLVDSDRNSLQGKTIDQQGWRDLGTTAVESTSIVGEVVLTKKLINIGCDLYQDKKRSKTARDFDLKNKYRTCSLLCVPIFNSEDGALVAVLQLINKKRKGKSTAYDFEQHKDKEKVPDCFSASFNQDDENQVQDFGRTVGAILHEILLEKKIREMKEKFENS
ncbi:MAG: GAF domain-containing protein [Leptolyngbyaceae cyanobacterium SM1_1_3]|nr:GAF domain-containing protein [Leptolyngbyaceae cyanobacterium SM1_1_3]